MALGDRHNRSLVQELTKQCEVVLESIAEVQSLFMQEEELRPLEDRPDRKTQLSQFRVEVIPTETNLLV